MIFRLLPTNDLLSCVGDKHFGGAATMEKTTDAKKVKNLYEADETETDSKSQNSAHGRCEVNR